MSALTPLLPTSNCANQTYTMFHPLLCDEIILILFQSFGYSQMAYGSLVCKKWRHYAGDWAFWGDIFFQAGIPMKIRKDRDALQAYLEHKRSSLSIQQLRGCQIAAIELEELPLKFDFSKYGAVHFLDHTHIVAHDEEEICILPLKLGAAITKINTGAYISSLCATSGMIFCTIDSQYVLAYSSDGRFLYSIDAHANDIGHPFIRVLADEQWLITFSKMSGNIKLWDRTTGNLVRQIHFSDHTFDVQLNCGTLYWTSFSKDKPFNQTLYYWPLEGSEYFHYPPFKEEEIGCLGVYGNYCAYIIKDPEVPEQDGVMTFDFLTQESSFQSLKSSVFDGTPHLLAFNKLAVVIYNTVDQFESVFSIPSESEDSDVHRFIGINQKKSLDGTVENQIPNNVIMFLDTEKGQIWQLFKHDVARFVNGWAFTASHGGISYITTDHKIIRTTFSQSQSKKRKRLESSSSLKSSKRQKN